MQIIALQGKGADSDSYINLEDLGLKYSTSRRGVGLFISWAKQRTLSLAVASDFPRVPEAIYLIIVQPHHR